MEPKNCASKSCNTITRVYPNKLMAEHICFALGNMDARANVGGKNSAMIVFNASRPMPIVNSEDTLSLRSRSQNP